MSFTIEINGNEINSTEDIKNNFDCACLLNYKDNFDDWLEGVDYYDEADKVRTLPKDLSDWQWLTEIAKILAIPNEVLENAKHDYLRKLQEQQSIEEKATSELDEKDSISIEYIRENFDINLLLKYKENLADLLYNFDYKDEADKVRKLSPELGTWGWLEEVAKILSVPNETLKKAIHNYCKQVVKAKASSRESNDLPQKPYILICGKSNVGKTSLINVLAKLDIVSTNAMVDTNQPTNKCFVVHKTPIANFIDAEAVKPGMTITQYADFIQKEIQTSLDDNKSNVVITSILYCITGNNCKTINEDIKLIKTWDKRLHIVVTKLDAMDKEEIKNINQQLVSTIDQKNIFMLSSKKYYGLARLIDSIQQQIKIYSKDMNLNIISYNKSWDEYYILQKESWKDAISTEANSFIYSATGRAAAIAITPIPLTDVAPLIANELYMIYKIGNLYGYAVTSQILTMLAGVAGASFSGKLLASFLPGVKILIATGITFAVGKVAKAYFESGMKLDENELKEKYKQAEKESKKTNWEKAIK
jgi:uncharacterized protein (DUF697 family)/GTP-binding protein EngB required for normal cell division